MAQVTLLGASYSDVPAVTLPQTGGGDATFYEYNFMGKLPEFVQTVYTTEMALEDTGFATWTPSTSAATIVSSVTAGTFSADFANYEYILKWETSTDVALQSGATTKTQLIWEGADQYQMLCKRPNSLANIQAMNFNGNVCFTYFTVPFMRYYDTNGKSTYTHSISYGIYPTLTAATFSNSTSNTPTVTIKTPAITTRCYKSYFTEARAAEVDQENTSIKIVGKLYRINIAGAIREMYRDFYTRFNAL